MEDSHHKEETFKDVDNEEVVITKEAVEDKLHLEEEGAEDKDFRILSNLRMGRIKWLLASNNFLNKWHPKIINSRCAHFWISRRVVLKDQENASISILQLLNNHNRTPN